MKDPQGLNITLKEIIVVHKKIQPHIRKTPLEFLHQLSEQGEAVCWRADGRGYFTLSEEAGGIQSHLYFYPRLKASSVGKSEASRSEMKEIFPW